MSRKPTDRAARTFQRAEAHRQRVAPSETDVETAEALCAVALVASGRPVVWAWQEARARQGHRRLGTLVAVAAALGVK